MPDTSFDFEEWLKLIPREKKQWEFEETVVEYENDIILPLEKPIPKKTVPLTPSIA